MISPGQERPLADPTEEVLFDGNPALVPSVGKLLLVIVTLGLWLIPLWVRSRGRRYRITTRRVVVETGLFNKRLEQVDLYRVNDYAVDRPLSQRMMGTGNLILRVLEKHTEEIVIADIKADVVNVYERVRAATEIEKTRRGVRVMDLE
jgi:uncharacterized membrane protein YdbT with pleckstrin-like domain